MHVPDRHCLANELLTINIDGEPRAHYHTSEDSADGDTGSVEPRVLLFMGPSVICTDFGAR